MQYRKKWDPEVENDFRIPFLFFEIFEIFMFSFRTILACSVQNSQILFDSLQSFRFSRSVVPAYPNIPTDT